MGKFIPIRTTNEKITNNLININDGQLLFTSDSKKLYLDINNERIQITDFIDLDSMNEIPSSYIYYKDKIYVKDGLLQKWNGESLETIQNNENKIIYKDIIIDEEHSNKGNFIANEDIFANTIVISESNKLVGITKDSYIYNGQQYYNVDIIIDDINYINTPDNVNVYYFSNNSYNFKNGSIKYPYNGNDFNEFINKNSHFDSMTNNKKVIIEVDNNTTLDLSAMQSNNENEEDYYYGRNLIPTDIFTYTDYDDENHTCYINDLNVGSNYEFPETIVIPATHVYNNVTYKVIGREGGTFFSGTYLNNIKCIIFPKGYKTINPHFFNNLQNLKEIIIPNTIIGLSLTTYNYSNILNVYYMGTEEQWNNINYFDAYETDYVVYYMGESFFNFSNVKFIGKDKNTSKLKLPEINNITDQWIWNDIEFENLHVYNDSNILLKGLITNNEFNKINISFNNCMFDNDQVLIYNIKNLYFKKIILNISGNSTIRLFDCPSVKFYSCNINNILHDNTNLNNNIVENILNEKLRKYDLCFNMLYKQCYVLNFMLSNDEYSNVLLDNIIINGGINISCKKLTFIGGKFTTTTSHNHNFRLTANDIDFGTFDFSKVKKENIIINCDSIDYNKIGLSTKQIYNDSGLFATNDSSFKENELFYRTKYNENHKINENEYDEDYNEDLNNSISLHSDLIKIDEFLKTLHQQINIFNNRIKNGYFYNAGTFLNKQELDLKNDLVSGSILKYIGLNELTLNYNTYDKKNIDDEDIENKLKTIDINLNQYEIKYEDILPTEVIKINDPLEFPEVVSDNLLEYVYNDDNDGYVIVGHNIEKNIDILVIPETYNDGEHGEKNVFCISNGVFAGNSYIHNVIFPGTLKDIQEQAFRNCSNLESIILGHSNDNLQAIHNIGHLAFANCSHLKCVTLDYTVEGIKTNAFQNSNNIEKLIYVGILQDYENLNNYYTIPSELENAEKEFICSEDVFKKYFDYTLDEDFIYSIKNDTFHGCIKDVIVKNEYRTNNSKFGKFIFPDSIDGYNIYSLKNNCFSPGIEDENEEWQYGNKLQSVVLPSHLIYIGEEAFKNQTELETIKFTHDIKIIDDFAFANCNSLINVQLPDSVETLGTCCFVECINLKQIKLSSNLFELGRSCFMNCRNLNDITIPQYVQIIPDSCFTGCFNLKNVELPNNLISIGFGSFEICVNLEYIQLPSTLENIGDSAFQDCNNLEMLIIPSNIKNIGNNFIFNTNINYIIFENNTNDINITSNTFKINTENNVSIYSNIYCDLQNNIYFTLQDKGVSGNIYSVDKLFNSTIWGTIRPLDVDNSNIDNIKYPKILLIPDKIKNINIFNISDFKNIHSSMENVEKVILNDNIFRINTECFKNCTKLEYVKLSKNILYIEENAFEGCKLEFIEIPKLIRNIDNYAFKNCSNLKTVKFLSNPDSIGNDAFIGCSQNLIIYCIQGGSVDSYCEQSNIKRIYTYAHDDTFKYILKDDGYYSIAAVNTSIDGNNSIAGYSGWLYIPMMYYNGNYNDYNYYEIEIKHIEDNAFKDCNEITLVNLSETYITDIGESAFENCSNLEVALLPDDLSYIGKSAFKNCSNLKRISYYNNLITEINESVFENCEKLRYFIDNSIYLLYKIHKNAFKNCYLQLLNLYIPTNIEKDAFKNCNVLTIFYNDSNKDVNNYCLRNNIECDRYVNYDLIKNKIYYLNYSEDSEYPIGYYSYIRGDELFELIDFNTSKYILNIPFEGVRYVYNELKEFTLNFPIYIDESNGQYNAAYISIPFNIDIPNNEDYISIEFFKSDFNNIIKNKVIELVNEDLSLNVPNSIINKIYNDDQTPFEIYIEEYLENDQLKWRFKKNLDLSIYINGGYELILSKNDRIVKISDDVWDKLIDTSNINELNLGYYINDN